MISGNEQARIRQLESEKERLLDEIDILKSALVDRESPLPAEWRLSPMESQLFRALLKREVMRIGAIMVALYSDRLDQPSDAVIWAFVFKMRRKLKPFGIEIRRVRGVGYSLDPQTRARLKEKVAA